MTIKNLQNKIYLLYHGDPSVKGSIGYLESLLRGRGQFEDLWSREELNTNIPERNADRVSAFDLVLKDCYSRDYQNRYVACWLSIHYKISCRHWNEKYVHFNYWSNSIEDGSACPAELEEGLSIWVAIFTP